MNSIDETALINLVQKYPLLYDLTSPLYNDQQKKDEAWNEISILTSASAYDCKTKWTRLRDNYRKALIVRNRNSGRGKDRAVKYEKQLSFLNEKFSFTLRKNVLKPEPLPCQDTEEPQVKVLAMEMPSVITEDAKAPKKVTKTVPSRSNGVRPVHELNAFFDSIAETVKTFPKKIQIQLKRNVFKLVNDTEASLEDNENLNVTYYSTESSMPEYMSKRNSDSPSNININEYTVNSINPQQTTEMTLENYCDFQIKEEIN